jgi:hypothetical protein
VERIDLTDLTTFAPRGEAPTFRIHPCAKDILFAGGLFGGAAVNDESAMQALLGNAVVAVIASLAQEELHHRSPAMFAKHGYFLASRSDEPRVRDLGAASLAVA